MKRLQRLGAITAVLVKHGGRELVERLFGRAGVTAAGEGEAPPLDRRTALSPRRLRLALEELGPSFIKLGQLLSTRADLLPAAYVEELRRLQDQVPPVPFAAVKKVVEDELGRPLAGIFKEFEESAVAAASVAQVHRARLENGDQVAVKVVRPGIAGKIRADIRLMYYFAAKLERASPAAKSLGAVNLVREFERTVFQELDMHIEAGSIEKFAAKFKDIEEIHIPAVYWEHTAKSVLVMEFVAGIKMDRVAELEAHGLDPKEVALIGLRSFSRQLMEFGFFHADPHPANVIVMYDGRVALVDFGIMGYLEEETMRRIATIFLGYAEHDYDLVLRAIRGLGLIEEDTVDIGAFRQDLKDVSEPFYGRSLRTISVKDVYEQVMQLLLRHRIRLPRNLLLLLKTFMQTEALGKILGSDASILEVTRPFAKNLLRESHDPVRMLRDFRDDLQDTGGYLKALPKLLHDLLQQGARGKQRLELSHSGLEPLARRLEKSVSRLVLGLVVAASLIAAALILSSGQALSGLTVYLGGGWQLPLATLLGLAGYLLATFLGIWLVISILRSGRR